MTSEHPNDISKSCEGKDRCIGLFCDVIALYEFMVVLRVVFLEGAKAISITHLRGHE